MSHHCLRLHAAPDGAAWYAADDGPAVRAGGRGGPQEALAAAGVDPAAFAEVVAHGTAANAGLITLAQARRLGGGGRLKRVTLVCPRAGGGDAERDPPAAVLGRLRHPDATCLLWGQRHALAQADFVTYSLIAALAEPQDRGRDKARRLFRHHPAWPALSFLPTLDEPSAQRLVAAVVDPRWFAHPHRPGRLSRLDAYLGLTPGNALAYHGKTPPGRRHDHFLHAVRAWHKVEPVLGEARYAPGNFLWRAYLAKGGGPAGLLAATRRLVRFVALVWLAATAAHKEAVFLPAAFLHADEARAFELHRRSAAAAG